MGTLNNFQNHVSELKMKVGTRSANWFKVP